MKESPSLDASATHLILPDLTRPWEGAVCVEIKMKAGFIPAGAPPHSVRNFYCPFCLFEASKCARTKISPDSECTCSDFCPLDLFSGDSDRVDRAVNNLFERPSNVLKIWHHRAHAPAHHHGDALDDANAQHHHHLAGAHHKNAESSGPELHAYAAKSALARDREVEEVKGDSAATLPSMVSAPRSSSAVPSLDQGRDSALAAATSAILRSRPGQDVLSRVLRLQKLGDIPPRHLERSVMSSLALNEGQHHRDVHLIAAALSAELDGHEKSGMNDSIFSSSTPNYYCFSLLLLCYKQSVCVGHYSSTIYDI